MKRVTTLLAVVFLVLSVTNAQYEIYDRTLINVPAIEPTGFGNFVAGVDLDGDGLPEVYAINNNWNDAGEELIPRITKFERNSTSGAWEVVWNATLPVPLQNTWPTIAVADLDGDGKKEIVWGPVNFTNATTNPNPPRLVVFEVKGDGSDTLGIPDGNGGYKPNTQTSLTVESSKNIRPFKLQAWDFNHDGKSELVFSDRGNSVYRFAVVGVNSVPDNGDTTGVVWSYKFEGLVANTDINAGTYYDFAIVDSTIFFINSGGNVQPVSYANGVYTLKATQLAVVPGGSWKSSATYDLDGVGSKEIIVGGWTSTAANKKVHVLQIATDSTLTEAVAVDVSGPLTGGQLYSGAVGDVDGDGKPDYVFGSRDANAKVFRLEYQGGGIANAGNYTLYEIDRGVVATSTRMDVALGNVDGVAGDEVFYSSSVDGRVPIVVLNNGGKAVNLTFNANTSTVPDTLKVNSTVQMRGDGGATGGLLDWSGNTKVKFSNVGGDYWRTTVLMKSGADFPYKLYTHAQPNVGGGHPGEHNGWENDINGNNDRHMMVGQNDSTVAVEFVNGSPNKVDQFWRPYVVSDSIAVTFRVNMANQEDFNPTTQKVGVNGSFNGWGGPTFFLKQESNHGNGGSVAYDGTKFWSGTFKLPITKAMADTLSGPMEYAYKFVQVDANTKWESVPDRKFTINKGSKDTTLYWKWWDDVGTKPPAGTDTAIVKFRVDMTRAIQTNGYVVGDTVQVRYGFANSAKVVGQMNLAKEGLTFFFSATDSMITGVNVKGDGTGKPLVYQYYLVKNGQDYREVYYNFNYTGTDQTLAERRLTPLTAKSNIVQDTSKNQTNATRWPFWRNTRKLTQNVDVKFEVNLQPAYYQVLQGAAGKDTLFDIQGPWTITKAVKDSIYKWGVSINGPATGGWASWGTSLYDDATRKMYDDGTNGDAVAGDHIYTRIIKFYKDSLNNVVGQEFKFGIHGGDNEGGKGGFGNNHIENINDAGATTTIHSQFGSINPLYYDTWDFAAEKAKNPLSVAQTDASIPTVYALEQNFPNPFNPSTTIKYALPLNGIVTLKIYNILGQEVASLVNQEQAAGNYTVSFNASHLASGMYVYRIESGSFSSIKKMMLIK